MRGSPLLLSLVESQRLHNKVVGSHLAPRDEEIPRRNLTHAWFASSPELS